MTTITTATLHTTTSREDSTTNSLGVAEGEARGHPGIEASPTGSVDPTSWNLKSVNGPLFENNKVQNTYIFFIFVSFMSSNRTLSISSSIYQSYSELV
jgi:hypothetical protein